MYHNAMNAAYIPTLAIPNDFKDDPVSKAVYDNIMGKLPTKKPKVSVYCKVCNLEFSSQTVLNTHLAGSKHQRKIKSKDLMKNLTESETGIERNLITGVIKCTLCDVTVNSPQLLATHVAGNKHQAKKGKRVGDDDEEGEKEGEGATPAKKLCSDAEKTETNGDATEAPKPKEKKKPKEPKKEGEGDSGETKKKEPPPKKERPPLDIEIPSCVTKLEDNKNGGRFLCNPCQAHCNSDIQLSQHLQSKKHIDKLAGKKPAPSPYSRGGSGGGRSGGWKSLFGRGRTSSTNRTLTSTAPTTSTSWDSFSSGLSLGTNGTYGQSYTDSSLTSGLTSGYTDSYALGSGLSSGYSDSYGLSSLGRTVTDYSYDRTGAAAASRATASTRGTNYARADLYGRVDAYGRVESPYARSTDIYDRSAYTAEYPVAEDLGSYTRATAEYAAADYGHGYAAPALATAAPAAGRGVPITYTAPLSHNFVAGSSIL